MTTFIVIGGGLIGAASALRLQQAGFEVTLVDPGAARRGASFGNAGHIAVEQAEPPASPATMRSAAGMLFGIGGPLDFRWRDAAAWAPWALRFVRASTHEQFARGTAALSRLLADAVPGWRRLMADVGRPDLLREDGHAVLWLDEKAARRGGEAWGRAMIGPARFREMTPDELRAWREQLPSRPPVHGLRFDGTARLRSPGEARRAILAAFSQVGGRIVTDTATSIRAGTDIEVTTAGVGVLKADRLLVAAGVWSGPLMRQLGLTVPLIAERGYSIQTPAPDWPDDLPTAVIEDLSLVLAPHLEGLRCTSHVEFGRPDAPPDPRKWARIEDQVRSLGLSVAPDAQRWMGPRPTLPDYLPAIGALEAQPSVLYAFGHQHLGVTLAARTAERIAALALAGASDLADPDFRIERFG